MLFFRLDYTEKTPVEGEKREQLKMTGRDKVRNIGRGDI